MDKQAEQRVIDAVKLVSASVEGGDHPNDAVVKAASRLKLGRQMLPLVVSAYNVGRTTFQREHGGESILAKQAEFPIAHLETIVSQLYPENPTTPAQTKAASAVDIAYHLPPGRDSAGASRPMEKAAHVSVRLPEEQRPAARRHGLSPLGAVKAAYARRDDAERQVSQAGTAVAAARDAFLGALGAVADYFKQASGWRLPFGEVEWNAVYMFGEPAKHAMDYAYQQARLREKRASGPPSLLRAASRDEAPYSLIKVAIDRGARLVQLCRRRDEIEKQAVASVEVAFRPFEPEPRQPPPTTAPSSILGGPAPSSRTFGKDAGFLTSMLAVGAGNTMRNLGDPTKATGDLVDDAASELNDPNHLQEMRDIQTRAMLSDFLGNDEVISGYEPAEVLSAFNEIAQLSPRTANQPAVMRPLLRKRLTQGAMEPFEAQQIADIEKTMSQSQSPFGGQHLGGMKLSEVLRGSPIL